MTTDAENKARNAVAMARVVNDTIDVVDRHVAEIIRTARRYEGQPEFWAHLTSIGRAARVRKMMESHGADIGGMEAAE